MKKFQLFYDPERRADDCGYWNINIEPPLEQPMIEVLEAEEGVIVRTAEKYSSVSGRWPHTGDVLVGIVHDAIHEAGHHTEVITPQLRNFPIDRLLQLVEHSRAAR